MDIVFPTLKNKRRYVFFDTIIETKSGEVLFEGTIVKGRLKGKIEPSLVNHAGWRSRLTIKIGKSQENNFQDGILSISVSKTKPHCFKICKNSFHIYPKNGEFGFDNYQMFARASLKHGKLHGLVQVFGIHSRNHDGHCTEIVDKGLKEI